MLATIIDIRKDYEKLSINKQLSIIFPFCRGDGAANGAGQRWRVSSGMLLLDAARGLADASREDDEGIGPQRQHCGIDRRKLKEVPPYV